MKIRFVAFLALVSFAVCGVAQQRPNRSAAPTAAQKRARFKAALEEAQAFSKMKQWDAAITAYKSALALNPRSAEAYLGLAKACFETSDFYHAKQAVERGLDYADTDALQGELHFLRGNLLYREVDEGDRARMWEAIDAWAAALSYAPEKNEGYFRIGRALLKINRDTEGIFELKKYLATNPTDEAFIDQARQFLEDPRHARDLLPHFRLPTADGKTLTDADLRGKIVVVEFWASWCVFCKIDIPDLKETIEQSPAERVVVLSISLDENEADWRGGIAKEGRTWLQLWDKDDRIGAMLSVHALPSQMVIDGEGNVRYAHQGLYERSEESLAARVSKLLKGEAPEARKAGGGQ